MTDDSQDLLARARELEESGKLEPALELYRRLLDREAPAAAMAQRHLRAAEVERALDDRATAASDYERASALFAEAGLDNLALAVDQRLLRLDPEHTEAYLRLGRLSAEHGYERDARRGYVEFADRISAAGDSDRAVEALQSYLESFPSDDAVRRRLTELGGTAVAAPEPLPAEPEPSLEGESESQPQPLEDLGLQPTSLAEQEEEWEPAAPAEPEPEPEPVVLEGFEPTGATEWEEVASDEDELPLIGNAAEGLEPVEEALEEEPTGLDEPLPLLGAMGEEEEVEAEEVEVGGDDLDSLERRVARAEESGDRFELAEACLALARRAEAELDAERARELYRRVLELDPVNEEARRGVG
ncbi:MAG TPA: tetratricopeptide repeat protein, partial [Longimicrobiaceae bacterium]|nr:tetratricopeptide repeat protein [Longimicrobiaceae bacterium]